MLMRKIWREFQTVNVGKNSVGWMKVFSTINLILLDLCFPLTFIMSFHPFPLWTSNNRCVSRHFHSQWSHMNSIFTSAFCMTEFTFSWLAASPSASIKYRRLLSTTHKRPRPFERMQCSRFCWESPSGKVRWPSAPGIQSSTSFKFRSLGIQTSQRQKCDRAQSNVIFCLILQLDSGQPSGECVIVAKQ